MSYNISYPYAQHIETKKLIHISQVTKTNKDNLSCPDCKEIFSPVIKHSTPHFRHKPNSNCSLNSESYIHWLSKEAFKEIKEFSFPEILISDLSLDHEHNFQEKICDIVGHSIPHPDFYQFFEDLKKNLSDTITLPIDKIETEKTYKTSLGDVRIDIVLTINNQPLFIEPHYTNPISEEKQQKLIELNIPTISIPLKDFIQNNPNSYTIKQLIEHLKLPISKKWAYIRPNNLNFYINKYYKYVQDLLLEKKEVHTNLADNYILIDKLYEDQHKLNDKMETHLQEIRDTRAHYRQLRILIDEQILTIQSNKESKHIDSKIFENSQL